MSRWLSSSGAAGAATLLSRILGFVRESAYAAFMGERLGITPGLVRLSVGLEGTADLIADVMGALAEA